jgi:hypothetical protein
MFYKILRKIATRSVLVRHLAKHLSKNLASHLEKDIVFKQRMCIFAPLNREKLIKN